MNARTKIQRADRLFDQAEFMLSEINKRLQELLDDESAHVHRHGGGEWVVCFEGGMANAALSEFNIDDLLKMKPEEALATLNVNSI